MNSCSACSRVFEEVSGGGSVSFQRLQCLRIFFTIIETENLFSLLKLCLWYILLVAVENRNDLHVSPTFRTDQRINLKDHLDKHCPRCQSLVVTLLRFRLFLLLLLPHAHLLVRVPAILVKQKTCFRF